MLAVLALNLIPAVCVLMFGWNVGLLLLLYWAENVVIGAFQALKMLIVSMTEGVSSFLGTAFFFIPFFCVHYGLFCLAHLMFVLMFIFYEQGGPNPEALDTPNQLPAFLDQLWAGAGSEFGAVDSLWRTPLADILSVVRTS